MTPAAGGKSDGMLCAPAVTVVVNGAIVSGSAPACIFGGRVVAPLGPIVVRLVSRAGYQAGSGSIAVERGSLRISTPVVFVLDGLPYVELGPLARGIGGSAVYDAPTKTLSIVMAPDAAIATPAPFDPGKPQVAPTTVFTPPPPPPTPRRTDAGAPHPRRTAVPAAPSEPVVPSPANPPP
jgi:hypothetical protein